MPSETARPSIAQWARFGWNLVNLSTPLGLLMAVIGRCRLRRGPRGLFFAEGYRYNFPRAGAFTVGNVILTRQTMDGLEVRRPGTLDHEDVHAWQYTWLLGLPFLPVYLACAGWSWLRTGDPASRNAFERQAGLVRGGYLERPPDNAGLKAIGRWFVG
ncbi:MAG: hypothetical protein VB080_07085 [Propionicimonas sp.]|uniref:hypothetical protein n=1 Tax=Propionicimonas sp. TaxID=1955623 RepID=UPI002B20DE65|nr:hypothetical protein [Propionicimonas sp.]MEA4944188.1 hypothetical protein [Propionicimonas sp.]MEA5052621.1 hypothetical protein [Propionicimonas sp.]MEA5116595.1 hypothetical protein [Propionicimonas sp.]